MRINVFSESVLTVDGHGVHSVYEDNLLALEKCAGVNVFSSLFRRADVVHLHTVGPMSLCLMRYGAPRSVVTAHITTESLAGSIVGGHLFVGSIQKYLRWFYNKATIVVALSEYQRKHLSAMGVTSEINVVPNGAPGLPPQSPTRAQARVSLGLSQAERVVLSVGQVQPRKGISVFHQVALAMPDTLFIWVGGFPFGPITSDYWEMRRFMENPPENLRHIGQLSREDVKLYYAAADVYFHPSLHELAPMAVLEAASHRLPLVLRDLDCYRTAFRDHYLPGTEQTFSRQIDQLFTDSALRDRMSEQAASLARALSLPDVARTLLSVYRRAHGSRVDVRTRT